MNSAYDWAVEYSNRWLSIIRQSEVTEDVAKWIIEESKINFAEHFNKGWLEYRKSVTEAGDWAMTEWSGKGAQFQDVLGRKFIDCLGGYGMMDLGWGHPEVVAAVKAQLERSPMPSQELIDPLRGVLARILAEILPGDIKYCFFCASGTEAIEGSLKLAKMYTRKPGFITALKGFHGKTLGSLSVMGKSDYRQPPGILYGGPVYHVPFGMQKPSKDSWISARKWGLKSRQSSWSPFRGRQVPLSRQMISGRASAKRPANTGFC